MKRSRKGSLFAHVLVAMNMVPFAAGSPESVLMSMAWLAMIASVRYRSEEQLGCIVMPVLLEMLVSRV